MLKRSCFAFLEDWKQSSRRKPLIVMGARQVGKSVLIREFGRQFENYVEINFEKTPEFGRVFNQDLKPQRIVSALELLTNQSITPQKTLLFFDEIQECPQALKSLRYFFEEMPQLHLISAGSLLEFQIQKQGLAVGRVQSLHLFPFSFHEFLIALGESRLSRLISEKKDIVAIEESAHRKLLELLKLYTLIGGMPEVINAYVQDENLKACSEVQQEIVSTYRQDFRKYTQNSRLDYVEDVFNSVPRLLGCKFIAAKIRSDIRSNYVFDALNLLVSAGVLHKVHHSSSNGIPLGSERDLKHFKVLFLDIGLAQRILGIKLDSWVLEDPVEIINRGAIAEQLVGQELIAYSEATDRPELHYWHREARTSNAEVDYVTALEGKLYPIEVKHGPTGRLRSLEQFLLEKKGVKHAIKCSSENFGSFPFGKHATVYSIPCYAVGSIPGIICAK